MSCPNKDKPGVQAAAKAKIDDIRIKRKAKKDVYNKAKKAKTSANAAFEALSDEQKAACIADATRRISTATTTTPASGSSAGSSNRQVFVVTVEAFAADTHRQAMPISIQSNLPHIILSLGASLDDSDCPDIRCALDTCAGICTGSYAYCMALAKRYPHILYRLYTSREYAPIILSGIVQNGDSAITTTLDCTFVFHLPYKLRGDGGDCLISIAAGKDVAVNVILGIPFIQAMKMIVDFVDNVATCNAIDHPPFPIDFRRTSNALPTPAVTANVSTLFQDTVVELEKYEVWRSAQVSLSAPRSVRFRTDTLEPLAPVPVDITDMSITTMSERQNLLHHNVQRMEGYTM